MRRVKRRKRRGREHGLSSMYSSILCILFCILDWIRSFGLEVPGLKNPNPLHERHMLYHPWATYPTHWLLGFEQTHSIEGCRPRIPQHLVRAMLLQETASSSFSDTLGTWKRSKFCQADRKSCGTFLTMGVKEQGEERTTKSKTQQQSRSGIGILGEACRMWQRPTSPHH